MVIPLLRVGVRYGTAVTAAMAAYHSIPLIKTLPVGWAGEGVAWYFQGSE